MKGRALRRALTTSDVVRVGGEVPLITDTTELVTPTMAQEMLQRNTRNRPINWRKVETYAAEMRAGRWGLHAQGIILDTHGNILTGQKRLWAVVYAGCNVLMRISRGTPAMAATLLDRGDAQSSRDLATRETGRTHSPIEASIARVYAALMGNTKPSTDLLAEIMAINAAIVATMLREVRGQKKGRRELFVLGAVSLLATSSDEAIDLMRRLEAMADLLDRALAPQTAQTCWRRGSAFSLAAEHAKRIVEGFRQVEPVRR